MKEYDELKSEFESEKLMWTVLKVDKNYISFLKKDFTQKTWKNIKFYIQN